MSDIAERLLERIEEIDQIAERAAEVGIANWKPEDPSFWFDDETPMDPWERKLIALHDPNAVRRRCAADREIIEWYHVLADAGVDAGVVNAMTKVLRCLARCYGVTP